MGTGRTFVIIGTGLAGTRAAATLRAEGFDGRVVLVGEERTRPYDHVPLSKHFLRREPGLHEVYLRSETFYRDHEIELVQGLPATEIDVAAREVTIGAAPGQRIGYDALLLATGSRARRLGCPGAELDGVHYLRTMRDAEDLRADLEGVARRGGHVTVIGAGWIGCEIAASARQMGCEVTVIGRSALPMQRALGADMARYFLDVHVAQGVSMHMGRDVRELAGAGRVDAVVLADGERIPTDAVVVGIGALPRTELAAGAGLTVGEGVVVDERLATSASGIYAAGDVARARNVLLGENIRLDHFAGALAQGPLAARAMLGQDVAYDQVPFFFSDQYDVWMEFTGHRRDSDELVARELDGGAFIAFWLRDGVLVAVMNVNIKGIPEVATRLIRARTRVDAETLRDPAVELTSLG